MFGKKKIKPEIDKEQLELFQNAQRRVKQKRRLYVHFVLFLIGALLLVISNIGLGIAKDFKIFELDWFVVAIIVWLFIFLYHVLNVFIINKFMGKEWGKTSIRQASY